MKKIGSDLIKRLDEGESMWVALPAKVIRQISVGIMIDAMQSGGVAELEGNDLKAHKRRFDGDGEKQT